MWTLELKMTLSWQSAVDFHYIPYIYMTRCVKFWLKVVNAHNRYMNACYNNLRILDEHGKTTWATQIKCLLLTLGFGYVWIHQSVGDVPQFLTAFRQRANDVARQTCLASIAQCKITLYSSYKNTGFWNVFKHWHPRASHSCQDLELEVTAWLWINSVDVYLVSNEHVVIYM